MARGLGAFAGGLAEGMEAGNRIALARQASERDNRRMALEEQRAKEASEQFGMTKQLTEQQIAAGKRNAEQEERKIAMNNQVSADTQALMAWKSGQAPAPEWLPSLLDGRTKKRGVGQEAPVALDPSELTETQFRRLMDSIQQKALIDHKMFDSAALERQIQFNKMIKSEGIMEAFDYFEQNQDSDKALKIFQKNGKFTDVPKGTVMKYERDPETGMSDIVVYTPTQDGKLQRYTSRSELLGAMMPENLVKYAQEMNKTRYQESRADARNERSVEGGIAQAEIGARSGIARAMIEREAALAAKAGNDPVFKQLETLIMDTARSAMPNPQRGMDIDRATQDALDTLETAYRIYSEAQAAGKPVSVPTAAAAASREVQAARAKQQGKK